MQGFSKNNGRALRFSCRGSFKVMQKQIYMVIGCPGSGKSWVCNQLRDRYHYVSHDDYVDTFYLDAIVRESTTAKKPLLIEAPFSISQLKDPLEGKGYSVTPIFIQEPEDVIRNRYIEREGKPILAGHLTRQKTYAERAELWHSFAGTSEQVLAYLKNAVPWNKMPWE